MYILKNFDIYYPYLDSTIVPVIKIETIRYLINFSNLSIILKNAYEMHYPLDYLSMVVGEYYKFINMRVFGSRIDSTNINDMFDTSIVICSWSFYRGRVRMNIHRLNRVLTFSIVSIYNSELAYKLFFIECLKFNMVRNRPLIDRILKTISSNELVVLYTLYFLNLSVLKSIFDCMVTVYMNDQVMYFSLYNFFFSYIPDYSIMLYWNSWIFI